METWKENPNFLNTVKENAKIKLGKLGKTDFNETHGKFFMGS